ncbi:ARM repeat-containing protein [Saitoella complicata NRRL Y-17804]|uniref:ARM repeat-containing protein n=1 Tax=Saitoella complicata (strain BCRC 22490 / CBS 7301 / JCM 7358 / NBRC 10748 / NRRL Y-17804) TaxID=698492 RepID=UPI000867FD2E|nr:ARM repeat-containing protein [Saitoella complicata NRRL Y-17804]ODQ56460.1 ARM repeat-containing protein [Saitoella complicata NRRL Y-17804]
MSSQPKPLLNGAKIKQRKRAQAASAKFEPSVFRDQIFKDLATVSEGDYDSVYQKLDKAGNVLDYHKYGETLWELLLTGSLLQPGGVLDTSERLPFNIFDSASNEDVIKRVDVFNRLIRRYKYLQRVMEETLRNILQFVNKWSTTQEAQVERLAVAVGNACALQLLPLGVLNVLAKEHLVKDGLSLTFVTIVLQSLLKAQSADAFTVQLKKSDITDILNFFPPGQRSNANVAEHFDAKGLNAVTQYHNLKSTNFFKEEFTAHVRELIDEEKTPDEVIEYLGEQKKKFTMANDAFVALVWNALIATIDMSAKSDTLEATTLKFINKFSPTFAAFATTPQTELALVQTAQLTCYEIAALQKSFVKIVQLLYKNDVVSDSAIMYWYEKGAKPQGKSSFLNSMQKFVEWLQEDEESDEE